MFPILLGIFIVGFFVGLFLALAAKSDALAAMDKIRSELKEFVSESLFDGSEYAEQVIKSFRRHHYELMIRGPDKLIFRFRGGKGAMLATWGAYCVLTLSMGWGVLIGIHYFGPWNREVEFNLPGE